jgi:hypothetical protein
MKYDKDYLKEKILNNQDWLERAIVAIYERQTRDEKYEENVKYNNNKCFTHSDAKRGSYYAKWILSKKHLTGIHVEKAKKMIQKYISQLVKVIKEKEENQIRVGG